MNTTTDERERERVDDVIDDGEPRPVQSLELRRPDVPVTLDGLAALKDEAKLILTTRNELWDTAWLAALRRTTPSDWVLFKRGEEDGGQITGYLQDGGGDRVRPVMGIGIVNVSAPIKIINGNDPTDFHYVQSADGFCRLTGERVYQIEGARWSKDDFAKDKTGTALEVAVRKACRANLDGSIVREFGFKSVAIEEIARAWQGTGKNVEQCHHGRGFGTRDQRRGKGGEQAPEDAAALIPPKCHICQKPMRLVKGTKGWFYSCADFRAHGSEARGIDLDKWKANPASRPKTAPAPATPAQNAKTPTPPSAEEVFGNHDREPGEEG
jgi:hypothetical protein